MKKKPLFLSGNKLPFSEPSEFLESIAKILLSTSSSLLFAFTDTHSGKTPPRNRNYETQFRLLWVKFFSGSCRIINQSGDSTRDGAIGNSAIPNNYTVNIAHLELLREVFTKCRIGNRTPTRVCNLQQRISPHLLFLTSKRNCLRSKSGFTTVLTTRIVQSLLMGGS